jgi:molybdenum cofactor biosynthesis enzyme MoaA
MTTDSYYCSQKFTWLSVDLEKKLTQSCCQADLTKIDVTWLKQNPGRLFNTPLLLQERQSMLDNQPVASCENACWSPERNNVISRRIIDQSYKKTHLTVESTPEILNIAFGSTCNLTCSYCCKTYSSAWGQDLTKNGAYLDDDRFKMNDQDRILLKLSQSEISESGNFTFLLDEVSKFIDTPLIRISGGEPFLYNGLSSLLTKLENCKNVTIHTGLGVNQDRFCRQLDKIQHIENLTLSVSAENIDKFYEFNRYGNSYENFKNNLNEIKSRNIKLSFNSVVSNLTVFGLPDFVDEFNDYTIHYSPCYDPDFLAVNVLDSDSIDQLAKRIDQSQIAIKDQLIESLYSAATREQQENLSVYLKEFARRRNLDLAIFPRSMLQWLSI